MAGWQPMQPEEDPPSQGCHGQCRPTWLILGLYCMPRLPTQAAPLPRVPAPPCGIHTAAPLAAPLHTGPLLDLGMGPHHPALAWATPLGDLRPDIGQACRHLVAPPWGTQVT